MISCPNDVHKEREIIKECIDEINKERDDDLFVELNHWVTDTVSDASMPAQESINKQIVEDSDGLIAIFNSRLGTPVHEYRCGTEEEIDLMLKAKKHVSLLFNTKPKIDLLRFDVVEQLTKLIEYKKEQSSKTFYREFSNEQEFKELVRREVLMWLRMLSKEGDGPVIETSRSVKQNNQSTALIEQPKDTKFKKSEGAGERDGLLDIVEYVSQSSSRLNDKIREYNNEVMDLIRDTNAFVEKFTFLNKQPNSQNKLISVCRNYARKMFDFSKNILMYAKVFSEEWSPIYRYTKMLLQDETIKVLDKQILYDAFKILQDKFEKGYNTINIINVKFSALPNYQRELSESIKSYRKASEKVGEFMKIGADNCSELISLM